MALTPIVYGEASVETAEYEWNNPFYEMVLLGSGEPINFNYDFLFRVNRKMGTWSEGGIEFMFCNSSGTILFSIGIGTETLQGLKIFENGDGFYQLGEESTVTNPLYVSSEWDPDWESFQQYNFLEWTIQWNATAKTFTVNGSNPVWQMQSRTYDTTVPISGHLYIFKSNGGEQQDSPFNNIFYDDGEIIANFWKDYQKTHEV